MWLQLAQGPHPRLNSMPCGAAVTGSSCLSALCLQQASARACLLSGDGRMGAVIAARCGGVLGSPRRGAAHVAYELPACWEQTGMGEARTI
jgi:hypothetical protein